LNFIICATEGEDRKPYEMSNARVSHEKMRNLYKISVKYLKGIDLQRDRNIERRIIIEWILKELGCGTSYNKGRVRVTTSCEHGNKQCV
jgi:hypothetical protein